MEKEPTTASESKESKDSGTVVVESERRVRGPHRRCRREPWACPTGLDMYCTAWESLDDLYDTVDRILDEEGDAWREGVRAMQGEVVEEAQAIAAEAAGEPPPPEDAEDHFGPIPLGDLGRRVRPGEGVARDLLLDGQIVTVVGEEGEGKSTLAWQVACQLAAGEDVGGHFEVEEPVSPVLIVDVEQSEEDAVILRDDMVARGLKVDGVLWLDAQGKAFDTPADQKWLRAYVRAVRPLVVILDTGTESVTRPREDESVKPLFVFLNSLLKNEGVRTVVLTAQPRKRSKSEPDAGRRFDDLFGSRVWKGRSSAVLYLEERRIVVWKQRGGYLRRRWGTTIGQYVRSDDGPATIQGPRSDAEIEEERRSQVLITVGMKPGQLSKSSLIEEELRIPGPYRAAWRKTVEALIAKGQIEARGQYHRLQPGHSA